MIRKGLEVISVLCLSILFQSFPSNLLAQPVAALYIGDDDSSLTILDSMGIAYISITPGQLDTIDLFSFSVFYVGSTFLDGGVTVPAQVALDSLNINKVKIRAFVEGGGGLVALSEPIGNGKWEWVPVTVAGTDGFASGFNDVIITNSLHPVMTGLTSGMLSNWDNSAHNTFTATDNLEIIATRNTSEPVTLTGEIGCGRVVLTGQDPNRHGVQGLEAARILLRNSLNWVADGGIPVHRKGDLNFDRAFTPSDVVLELNCVFLGEKPFGADCICDLNCDGAVAPSDVVLELNKVFLSELFLCT